MAKTFTVTLQTNGERYTRRGTDLNDALLRTKPEIINTDSFILVKRGKEVRERHLNLTQSRNLFRDDTFREIFINNLMLAHE